MGKLGALTLLVLLISANYPEAQAFSFGSILSVGDIVKDVIGTVVDIVGVFIPQKMAPDHYKQYVQFENDLKIQNNKMSEIFYKVDDWRSRLTNLEQKLNKNKEALGQLEIQAQGESTQLLDMMNRVDDLIKRNRMLVYTVSNIFQNNADQALKTLATTRLLNDKLEELHDKINGINGKFEHLMHRLLFEEPTSLMALRSLLDEAITYNNDAIRDVASEIETMFDPGELHDLSQSFPSIYVNYVKTLKFHQKCDESMTYQEKLKKIFNMIMITQIRVLVMMTLSFREKVIKNEFTREDARVEINLMGREIFHRSKLYIEETKRAFENITTEIMRCDPEFHHKDVNNFELNNLFTAYYMNLGQLDKRCTDSCYEINYRRELEPVAAINSNQRTIVPVYQPRHQCKGRLHNCKTLNKAQFCEIRNSNEERYRWITTSPTATMIKECDGDFINTMTNTKCDSCLCQCSEEGAESNATRAISLLEQLSDYRNNMVVTNMRFVKKNNMVHIQIEEGELLPEGGIKRGSQRWVPLPDLVYSRNTPEGSFAKIENNDLVPLVPNQEFVFLNYENRRMMLTDVKVNSKNLVTGVKFEWINEYGEAPKISISIHSTSYSYATGTLRWDKKDSQSWNNFKTDYSTNRGGSWGQINIEGAKDPMESLNNQQASESNKFIEFIPSGPDHSGHVTIPYFDARPAGVESNTALSGLGIFHRGSIGYGGFIAPKLLGVDHSPAMISELTGKKVENFLWYNKDLLN